jgi:hypothetical protein
MGGLPRPWAAEPPAIALTEKIFTKAREQSSQGQGHAAYPISQLSHGTSQTNKSTKAKNYAITYIGINQQNPANQCRQSAESGQQLLRGSPNSNSQTTQSTARLKMIKCYFKASYMAHKGSHLQSQSS